MPQEFIVIKGAREHNLKNIEISIPREKLVVITGVSGSGKSSLAFDTIYAEGQRRYVESLSAYARQFLGRMDKPDVDYIEGLSPAISIDQKGVSHNPRSTVGTVTEIYDYMRLLFARLGTPHCAKCGQPVEKQTVQQIADAIMSLPEGSRILLLAPKVRRKKGEHKDIFDAASKSGFVRVRVNGTVHLLDELDQLNLNRQKWHYIEIVVDRLIIRDDTEVSRVSESVEAALREGDGVVLAAIEDGEELVFSEQFACVSCGTSLMEIEPRTFSFNSPHGACNQCTGLGYKLEVDPDLVISNKALSLAEGAITPWSRGGPSSSWYVSLLESIAGAHGFSAKVPVKDLPKESLDLVLYGNGTKKVTIRHRTHRGRTYSWDTNFEGVIPNLERRYKNTESDHTRQEIERYMAARPCRACQGNRLRPEALAVTVCGLGIMEVCAKNVGHAWEWVREIDPDVPWKGPRQTLSVREKIIGNQILKEIEGRLEFLKNIGLDYVTLGRTAKTLSGGEAQRVRLATQIGSGLTGVLYVCDEPTVGLHPHDDHLLISTLTNLRDLGNTVIVVEHDEATIRSADYVVDLGPGAGVHGGETIFAGSPKALLKCKDSLTGQYLSGKKKIPLPKTRRKGNGKILEIHGARENNLKEISVKIPLGCFVCVTGVSGSGKSTLTIDILYKALARHFWNSMDKPGEFKKIQGLQWLDKVIDIDQSPIGRTPRSNPATYTGVFTLVRELFSQVPESRVRGYKPGRFSFNVKGGRCEACQGDGVIKIEMHFLPDVFVTCEVCQGKRFNRETLEILYKGKNIADILNMTAEEAKEFFINIPSIKTKLQTITDVGLDYIRLGQQATTLSGGEAQRVKLSKELSKRSTGRTLYILDEPTTGLHFADIENLLRVLDKLVDSGNTVIIIEHNMDVIKTADHIIDLGPEGGDGGGQVLAEGPPEKIAKVKASYTGQYLKEYL